MGFLWGLWLVVDTFGLVWSFDLCGQLLWFCGCLYVWGWVRCGSFAFRIVLGALFGEVVVFDASWFGRLWG